MIYINSIAICNILVEVDRNLHIGFSLRRDDDC